MMVRRGGELRSLLSRNLSRDTRQPGVMKLSSKTRMMTGYVYTIWASGVDLFAVVKNPREGHIHPVYHGYTIRYPDKPSWLLLGWRHKEDQRLNGCIHWSSFGPQWDDPDDYDQVSKRHGLPLTDPNHMHVHQIFRDKSTPKTLRLIPWNKNR